MKHRIILLILLLTTFTISAQYRSIDWKTNIDSVVVVDTDTFWVKVSPIDFNDPGAIDGYYGNYLIDFVGNRYSVVDSTSTAIKVASELAGSGIGPQSGQIGRVYRSVGNGDAPFIGGVDMTPLDMSARWKKIAADNELFWRSMITSPVDSLPFNPTSGIIHQEGTQFYDSDKKAMSYYNEVADVTINMGQENVVRAYNNTGLEITNLTPVYLDADSFKVGSNLTLIESRFIGVATHDIPPYTWGYATNLGEVGGDLSGFPDGALLYLGDGVLTNTSPSGGEFYCFIGKKKNDGILYVSPSISDYTAEMLKPTGWPDNDDNSFPDNLVPELRASDRTIKLSAFPASTYYHYQDGIKYISAVDSFQWSAVEGIHAIYFDLGSMVENVNPTDAELRVIKEKFPGVINLYWSIPQDTFIFANSEFHTFDMNGQTKGAFYDYQGCKIIDIIPLVDFDIDGGGNLNSHAQFGNTSGTIRNEDLKTTIPPTTSTTGYSVFYRSGVSSWLRGLNAGFGVVTTGTGRLAYNEDVAGSWQLTEATSNNYVPYFVLVSNTLAQKIATIPGQDEYASADAAVEGGLIEAQTLLQNLPVKEIAEVALVVFQTRDSYTNSVKSRIVSVTDPLTGNTVDYIDLRGVGFGGGTGGMGAGSFLDHIDTPGSYAGSGSNLVTVTPSEDGLVFTAKNTINVSAFLDDLYYALKTHATTHENAGTDEISVAGLSGTLADFQSVNTDATITGDGTSGSPLSAITDYQNLTFDAVNGHIDINNGTNADVGLFGTANTNYGFVQGSNGVGSAYSLRGDGSWALAGGTSLWQSVTNGIAPTTISDVVFIGSTTGTGGGLYELDVVGRGIFTEELAVSSYVSSAYNIINERASIGTPGSTTGLLWMNSADDKLYWKTSATEYDLTAGSGAGDVFKVGTPVDNQIGVWTGDGTIEGTTSLTFGGGTLDVNGIIDATNSIIGSDLQTETTVLFTETTSGAAPGVTQGFLYMDQADDKIKFRNSTTIYDLTSSGGAPTDATYITQTANGTLTNEQAMGALATGIVKNTTTTGVQSIAVAGDFPTLNQNTTGSAATLTIARGIYGNNFDGSAALTQIIASTYGGTGNGFTKFTGAATSEKTYTLPNATTTILTTNAAVTETQGGTNQTTYTTGDILYASSSNTLAKLAAGTENYVLEMGASIPAWESKLIQEVDNGAKTASFTHDATSASIGAYTLNTTSAVTISIHNLASGHMGTLFVDIGASNPSAITVETYSDAGSTGLTEVPMSTIANAANKRTTITYTCANNGTVTDVTIQYGQEQ